MCGFVLHISKNKISESVFRNSLLSINHRGPDNLAIKKLNDFFYIGHVRLSIIDLSSKSNQPFHNDKENKFLIFNGEIYNHHSLRKKLENNKIRFNTNGDTEVLYKILEFEKLDSIKDLNGMWSFIFINSETNELILSRDRYGKKPLYYYKDNKDFIVASEIKAIFEILNKTRKLRNDFLEYYISTGNWNNESKKTFYTNIYQLTPGEIKIIFYKDYKFKEESININNLEEFENKSFGDYNEIIKDSINIRLDCDVPKSIFISGGIDSSLIASLSLDKKKEIHWITGSTGYGNDLKYSKELAKNLKIDLDIIEIPYDLNSIKIIDEMTKMYEIPIPLIGNSIAMNFLYKKISEKGIRVVVDGTGGDEVFGGYFDYYYRNVINELINENKYNKLLKYLISSKNLHKQSIILFIKHIIRNKILKKLYKNKNNLEKNKNLYSLKEFQKYDCKFGRLQTWLRMNDTNSMMYSIETRSPLLDYRLFSFIEKNIDYKFKNGFNKYYLRSIMPNTVSDNIRWRIDKQGFRWSFEKFYNDNEDYIINNIKKIDYTSNYYNKLNLNNNKKNENILMILRLFSVSKVFEKLNCITDI